MAINCKICGQELDVFSGGRCRKCRQLVCKNCTASGGTTNARGLLCKSCAAAEEVLVATSAATAPQHIDGPSQTAAAFRLPAVLWIAAPLILLGVMVSIVGLPWIEARRHLQILELGEEPAAMEAAEALGRIASKYVVEKLQLLANNAEPARSRAILTLGRIPTTEVRNFLQQTLWAPSTPEKLRSVLVEALREQERRGWQPKKRLTNTAADDFN